MSITTEHKVAHVRQIIAAVENQSRGRFYGLENVTTKGVRRWSIAPSPPLKACAAIIGDKARPPDHILIRWAADKHAWRSIDLTTVRKIWFKDARGVRKEYLFD